MQKGISVLICLHIITTYTLVVSSLLLLPYEKCNCIFSSAVRSTEDYTWNFFCKLVHAPFHLLLFSLFSTFLAFSPAGVVDLFLLTQWQTIFYMGFV